MDNSFDYIQSYYNVPACIGRRVTVYDKAGIIVDCNGEYISVVFDGDKPTLRKPCHPVDGVVYLGMGEVPKMSRSQERYARFLKVADAFGGSFKDFLKYEGII